MLKYMSQQVSSPVAKAAAAAIAGMVLRLIYVSYPHIYMKVVIDIGMIFSFLISVQVWIRIHSNEEFQSRIVPAQTQNSTSHLYKSLLSDSEPNNRQLLNRHTHRKFSLNIFSPRQAKQNKSGYNVI